jgi:predicted nucleic acid-binding protein
VTYVLDASFAAALCLTEAESPATRAFFGGLIDDDSLLVPGLWWFEMSNLLGGAVARKRLSEADVLQAFEQFRRLGLSTDERDWAELSVEIFGLARLHGLTAYDAAYLELAARTGSILCSYDTALRAAASLAGIPLVHAQG